MTAACAKVAVDGLTGPVRGGGSADCVGARVGSMTNNLWVLIAALLVFTMTISVGFLEVGELGEELDFSLLKTVLMTGAALVVMAVIGFNTAFAPTTAGGLIGRPFYEPGFFLGGFSTDQ